MFSLNLENMSLSVDFQRAEISSLTIDGVERIAAKAPLFRFNLRMYDGSLMSYTAYDAVEKSECNGFGIYKGSRTIRCGSDDVLVPDAVLL